MAMTPIQINEIKKRLKSQGMSDDKIDMSIRMVQQEYEEKYGGSVDTSGVTRRPQVTPPQTTSRPTSQSTSTTPMSSSSMQTSQPQYSQPEGMSLGKFFSSLYDAGQNPQMVEQQQNLTGFKKVAQTVADAAPLVMGTVAGIAGATVGAVGGGIAGVGVGAVPGAAVGGAGGTAIGVAGGKAIENAIENLIGTQDQMPVDQVKEAVVDAGTAGVIDFATFKVLKFASPVIKKAFSKVGQVVAGKADDLALRAIRPSPSQQTKFFQKTGVELKDFTVDKGLFQKGVEQVDAIISPLQQQFDDIAKNTSVKINSNAVVQRFDDTISSLRQLPIEKVQTLADTLERNKELFIKRFGQNADIGADVLTQIRRDIDSIIPKSAWTKEPLDQATNSYVRTIYQESIQEAAEQAGLSVGGRNLKDIGRELSKLYSFREIAASQQYLGQGTLPVGLIKSIGLVAGAAGGATQGESIGDRVRNMFIGAGLVSFANNPKVISFATKNLLKFSDVIAGLPEKEAIKLTGEIVRRSMTNFGALQLSNVGDDSDETLYNRPTTETVNTDKTISTDTGLDMPTMDTTPEITAPEPEIPLPFDGMSKYELVQLAIAQGFTGAQLDEVRSTYDSIMNDYKEAVGGSGDLDALLSRRKALADAGRDVSSIDAQLEQMGYGASGVAPQGKMTEKERMFDNASLAAKQALDLLNTGTIKTGLGQGTLGAAGETFGTNSPEQQRYRSSIALARTTARNALLGANMTAGEMESIQAFIPEFSDAPNIAKEKLETFIGLMEQFSGKQPITTPDQKKNEPVDQRSQSPQDQGSMLASIGNWTSKVGKQLSGILERSAEDMERIQTADPSTLTDAELLFRKPNELTKDDQIRQFDAGMQFMGTTKSTQSIAKAFKHIPLLDGKTLYALARNIKKLSAEDIEILRQGYKMAGQIGNKAPTAEQGQIITDAIKIFEEIGFEGTRPTLKTVGKRIEKLVNYLADIDFKEIDYLENIGFDIPNLLANKKSGSNILNIVRNPKPIK